MIASLREVLALYRDAPAPVRAQMIYRWLSCPFARVANYVPEHGRILDVGCGHGLFTSALALGHPRRTVVGFDIDDAKLVHARAAAERIEQTERCTFVSEPSLLSARGPWDAVVMTDVLYLVPEAERRDLLTTIADSLSPGGVAVIKEIDDRPRWKYELALVQERLATRVLGITVGTDLRFESVDTIADRLAERGLVTQGVRVDQGYPYPHYLVLGWRPPTGNTLRP